MARFLIVVPPLTGHVNPTAELGRQLAERGHEVAWAGYPAIIGPLLPDGARLFAMGHDVPPEQVGDIEARARGLRGAAALEFLWRDFLLPLARDMAPGVERAVAEFAPDVIVADQQAFAGAVAARRHGIPWATSATTSAELVDPFQLLPAVGDWVRRGLLDLQLELGLDEERARRGDLRFSEDLIVAYSTAAMTGPLRLPPGAGPVVMVGPSLAPAGAADRRQGDPGLPAAWLEGGRARVLVTLGTVNAAVGQRFFALAAEALAALGVHGLMVADPEQVGPVPEGVLVRPYVPQLAVLRLVDAVVCHGGHNTVCEALAEGLPLVLAPIRDDQPIVAAQVVEAGAGIRLRYARARAADIAEALAAVLDDPSYRAGAAAVRASFLQAGGAAAAADAVARLA